MTIFDIIWAHLLMIEGLWFMYIYYWKFVNQCLTKFSAKSIQIAMCPSVRFSLRIRSWCHWLFTLDICAFILDNSAMKSSSNFSRVTVNSTTFHLYRPPSSFLRHWLYVTLCGFESDCQRSRSRSSPCSLQKTSGLRDTVAPWFLAAFNFKAKSVCLAHRHVLLDEKLVKRMCAGRSFWKAVFPILVVGFSSRNFKWMLPI